MCLKDGEIVGGVTGAGTHLVVGEDDIQAPVEAIFDRPMLTDRPGGPFGVRGEAADVEVLFQRGFAFDGTRRLDDKEGPEVGPLLRLVKIVELVECETAAMLDPP